MFEGWQHVVIALVGMIVMVVAALVQSTIGLASTQRLKAAGSDPMQDRRRSVASLANPRRTMAAAMALVQVLAAIIATGELAIVFETVGPIASIWLAILLVGLTYLVFGQALPRALAGCAHESFLQRTIGFAQVATVVLGPVTWLVDRVAQFFYRVLPGQGDESILFGLEEEMRPLRADGDDEVINADERVMIDGILSLEEMTARDIMVPRLDIVAVDRTVNPRDLIDRIVSAGHSRIPVYQESVDRIIGVLYAKDLLPFVIGNTSRIPILDLIRPAFVVPESKRLNELFAELRRTKIHIAIVADEYGGTAGLVTIEDVLEEIVGEIQDEFDTDDWLFEKTSDTTLLADGRLPIEDVEEALGIRFEDDDDFGTLGGFVHKHLGRLPIQGDSFIAEGVQVEIQAVERHRVRKLLLTRLPTDSEREATTGERDRERASWRRSDNADQAGIDDSGQPVTDRDTTRSGS